MAIRIYQLVLTFFLTLTPLFLIGSFLPITVLLTLLLSLVPFIVHDRVFRTGSFLSFSFNLWGYADLV